MKPVDLKNEGSSTPSHDPGFVGATAAMRRAALRARRRAANNGTPIAVFMDGKVVWLQPDDEVFSQGHQDPEA